MDLRQVGVGRFMGVGGTSARLPNEQASKGMHDRLPCTVCSMPVVFVGLGWLGAAVWILEGL